MYAAYDLTIHGSQNPLSHSSPLEGNNALPRNLRPYYVRDFLEHKSLKSTEVHINVEDTLFQSGPNDKYTIKVSKDPEETAAYLADNFRRSNQAR
jgi:hypothetical protein